MTKKQTIIAICLVLVLAFGYFVFRRPETLVVIGNKSDGCQNLRIEETQKQAQAIENNLPSYASTTKDIMDKSTEGGQQTDYTAGTAKVLVRQVFYGETGKSEDSFFFKNGHVFFVQVKESRYAAPIFEDPSGKVQSVSVQEYYLDDNQNVCAVFNGKNQEPITPELGGSVHNLILGL